MGDNPWSYQRKQSKKKRKAMQEDWYRELEETDQKPKKKK